MWYKRLKKIIVLLLLVSCHQDLFLKHKILKQHCPSTYKFPDETKYGVAHDDITRAGVILVVPTGSHDSDPLENYGIIVGHDKNLRSWMIGQAGKSDPDDMSTAVTAARELEEETGGFVKMSSKEIAHLPYIYAYEKQMFIYVVHDHTLASDIKDAVQKIQSDKHVSSSYKEIDDVETISLKKLLELAKKIDQQKVKRGHYFITTMSGKKIRLNTLYMQLFAHPCDHDRFEYAQKMFKALLK